MPDSVVGCDMYIWDCEPKRRVTPDGSRPQPRKSKPSLEAMPVIPTCEVEVETRSAAVTTKRRRSTGHDGAGEAENA
jgi:hypothetical protein